jgi:hypothetical protein
VSQHAPLRFALVLAHALLHHTNARSVHHCNAVFPPSRHPTSGRIGAFSESSAPSHHSRHAGDEPRGHSRGASLGAPGHTQPARGAQAGEVRGEEGRRRRRGRRVAPTHCAPAGPHGRAAEAAVGEAGIRASTLHAAHAGVAGLAARGQSAVSLTAPLGVPPGVRRYVRQLTQLRQACQTLSYAACSCSRDLSTWWGLEERTDSSKP